MKKVSLVVLIGALLFGLFGCSSNNTAGGSNGDTVTIGFTGPLSGAAAYYGERTLQGLEMAAEEINDAGGFEVDGKTYKLKIKALDDKYLPNEAAANAKRLVQEDKAPIIFTPHSGGVQALQVFNERDKFIIGAYTSEPGVVESGNKLTVQVAPQYSGYIEPFTTYAMETSGKKLAMLPPATEYGKDWAESLKPEWEKQGGKVVYHSAIDFAKDTDFFTIITNALKEKPDVLFIGGASEATAKVAKQARELGFKGGFIVMDQAKFDQMKAITGSYETFNNSIGVTPLIYSDFPGTDGFVEKYHDKYDGVDPSSESGLDYIALHAFVGAMEAAGTVNDAEKIREHVQDGLEKLPDDKKVYNIPGITKEGSFKIEQRLTVVENGEIKVITEQD